MRVVLVAAIVGALLAAGVGSALDPAPAKIRVTLDTNTRFVRPGYTYGSLYNKTVREKPIGFALLHCQTAIPPGTRICDGTYSLPHGRLDVHGLIGSQTVYTLSVTGGTGTYQNAGGQVDAVAIAPGAFQLVFSLRGF